MLHMDMFACALHKLKGNIKLLIKLKQINIKNFMGTLQPEILRPIQEGTRTLFVGVAHE